tara:strand:+ start:4178 stop:4546 length:369 start_codon:yes stop_codon:yes gene_type:complete
MSKTSKPKPYNGGEWTKARYFGFIRSNLRRARYPVIYKVKKAAERPYKGDNKRQKYEYQCAICKKWHMGKNVQVDHIKPCGSLKEFSDLPRFVETLYCEADNLRVLCKDCHQVITNEERKKK